MSFPVYPELHRKLARRILKARFLLLPLFVAGLSLFGFGAARNQGMLMGAGTLAGAVGFLYFGTFGARDVLVQVEIGEEEIRLCVKCWGVKRMITKFSYENARSFDIQRKPF